ncbi:MAG: hypothetical protein M9958_08040 [Chitinophagales bacterium]|nr:hypothetical protein [Chitinophagales bacterium]
MTTITIKINERTKAGKTLKELIEIFSKENKGVEIVSDKSPYNADFVAKIRRAEKQKSIKVNPNNIWESLGLK